MQISDCVEIGIINKSGFATTAVIGDCPLCGGQILEVKSGFICENNKRDNDDCCFYLSKEDKYLKKVTGEGLSAKMLSSLLKKGNLAVTAKSSKGKTYEVLLQITLVDEKWLQWKINPYVGDCPVCGNRIKVTPFGYICEKNSGDSNEVKDCFFVLYRNDKFIKAMMGKEITLSMVMRLLKTKSIIALIEKKDKSKKYKMKFTLNIDHVNRRISWEKSFVNKTK